MAARHRGRDVVEGLREQRRMALVVASEPGAKEKHSVPRVWPWCKETKSMARERRATRGRLRERISGLESQDPRGRGCKGSSAPMRGAATHRAFRRAGLTGGASRETAHDTPAQGVTQSGGYVECSPRCNSPRSGLEDCHGEVDAWPELVAGQRAHCG